MSKETVRFFEIDGDKYVEASYIELLVNQLQEKEEEIERQEDRLNTQNGVIEVHIENERKLAAQLQAARERMRELEEIGKEIITTLKESDEVFGADGIPEIWIKIRKLAEALTTKEEGK